MGWMSEAPPDGNDGLPCPEVRRWAETKYRLLGLYDELFATGMKRKWDQRIYHRSVFRCRTKPYFGNKYVPEGLAPHSPHR